MTIDLTLTAVDAYARRSARKFEGTATTLAQAETDKAALLTDFAAVSLAGVAMATYNQSTVESEAVETGANIDAGATLHCRLNNGKLYALKIPAIDPDLLNADGSVKIDNAAITNYVANFQSGGAYRVSEGNYIVSIEYGELDR